MVKGMHKSTKIKPLEYSNNDEIEGLKSNKLLKGLSKFLHLKSNLTLVQTSTCRHTHLMNGMTMKKLFGFMSSDFGVWSRLWAGRASTGNHCKLCTTYRKSHSVSNTMVIHALIILNLYCVFISIS